jgi:hypothetical protein
MIFPDPDPATGSGTSRIRKTGSMPRSRLTETRSESVLAGRFHSPQNVLRRSVLSKNGQFYSANKWLTRRKGH